jgi:8-oxo-dGTP diphosphatase
MNNLQNDIRNAVRAIIVQNHKLLVQKKQDGSYSLPGGAPHVAETLEQGLERECNEEIGTAIQISRLAFVADYFKPRKSCPPAIRHHIEFLFICSVPKNYIAQNGPSPDKRQVDVNWISIDSAELDKLVPTSLINIIKQLGNSNNSAFNKLLPTYLGTLE